MNRVIAISAALGVLAGCTLPPLDQNVVAVAPTTYHSVSYYDANPLARAQANAWCHDNPGLATKVPSCDSADESGIHAWNHQMGWK
jgi:hypothetical protein